METKTACGGGGGSGKALQSAEVNTPSDRLVAPLTRTEENRRGAGVGPTVVGMGQSGALLKRPWCRAVVLTGKCGS